MHTLTVLHDTQDLETTQLTFYDSLFKFTCCNTLMKFFSASLYFFAASGLCTSDYHLSYYINSSQIVFQVSSIRNSHLPLNHLCHSSSKLGVRVFAMENKAPDNLLLPCHLSEATSKCSPPAHSSLATQDCLQFSGYQVYTYLRAFALVVPSASKTFSLKMSMHNSLATFKSLRQCHFSTGLTQNTFLNCNLSPCLLNFFFCFSFFTLSLSSI